MVLVKGISASVMSALLLLISITSVSLLYLQIGKISSETISQGENALVDVKALPKLLAVSCSERYGYVMLSSDKPLIGKVYYVVKDGLDEIASGFAASNITSVGKIYFNATMTEESEYTVSIRSKYWALQDKCTASQDPGLILFLPFNETNSTTAKDWSLNGNDALVNADWVNGTSDNAIRFDGLTQYAKVNSNTGFDASKFTLSFWGMLEYAAQDNESFVEGSSFYIRIRSNGNVDFGLAGGDTISTTVQNKTWTQFIMRYDGSYLSVFKNCSLMGSKPSSYSPSQGDVYFGKGPIEFLTGAIDEVYFFSRSLENQEVSVFCNPLSIQAGAYNGTWTVKDGYCPPQDPFDPDCSGF